MLACLLQVLVEARVSAGEEGCSVEIEGDIVVDANTNDDIPPSTVSCEIDTAAISTAFAENAVAVANASAGVFACENTTELVADITATVSSVALYLKSTVLPFG